MVPFENKNYENYYIICFYIQSELENPKTNIELWDDKIEPRVTATSADFRTSKVTWLAKSPLTPIYMIIYYVRYFILNLKGWITKKSSEWKPVSYQEN